MPIPDSKPQSAKLGSGLHTLVKAEKLVQIALVLPTALVIGWGGGVLLDKWLHQHWIYLAGIIFGSVAGFIQIFRLVAASGKDHQ